jgi:serine O-acetyltransferase
MIAAAFREDLGRFREHEGGLFGCLRSPGVHALAAYRLGNWALRRPAWARVALDPLYFILNLLVQVLWGIEISRRAKIGPGLYIGHFGGITVSPLAVIGARCAISQCVTIGADRRGAPVIGDDVYIACGARLFGPIRVGDNVKIGANAVVHRDIPDQAVVALDPGFRILSELGNRRIAA